MQHPKYIIFKAGNELLPIIFPANQTHLQVRKAFEHLEVRSAGYFIIHNVDSEYIHGKTKVEVAQYGNANSIWTEPHPDDKQILESFFYKAATIQLTTECV